MTEAVSVMWNNDLVAPNLLTHYTELSGTVTLIPLVGLVGIAAAIVVGRGILRSQTAWPRKVGVACLCAATFVGGVAAVERVGSDWNKERIDGFQELGKFFVREEAKLPR
jgi:hypothetical protein